MSWKREIQSITSMLLICQTAACLQLAESHFGPIFWLLAEDKPSFM